MKRIISSLLALILLISTIPIIKTVVAAPKINAYSGAKFLKISNFGADWHTQKIDILKIAGKTIPSNGKFTVKISLAYRLEADDGITIDIRPDMVMKKVGGEEVYASASASKVTVDNSGWVYYTADYTYNFGSGGKMDYGYMLTGSIGSAYSSAALYVDAISVELSGDSLLSQDFEDFTADTSENELLNVGIHNGQWNMKFCDLKIIDTEAEVEEDKPLTVVHSGSKSLMIYDITDPWDTAKVDIMGLIGKQLPQNRKISLNVKVSYLLQAEQPVEEFPLAPVVHLSSDAQTAIPFSFKDSQRVKATTEKWKTFSANIECDLSSSTGSKVEWAYITLFSDISTDYTVYVDSIVITDNSGTLLDQGFESFSADASVEELRNGGVQTQWGGPFANECSFKIVEVKEDEEEGPLSTVHSGSKSLMLYDITDPWDTAKIDIKGLMGKQVPASRKLNLNVKIWYLLEADEVLSDHLLAPTIHLSTDAQTVKSFDFKDSQKAKATTEKWAGVNADIECDLGDTVGDKIEWAYITLCFPNSTEISIYIDDISVSDTDGEVLNEDFESFSKSSTVEDLKNGGIQTQWGGPFADECSFKINDISPETPPEGGELPAPDAVHSGNNSLLIYDLVNPWDTAKIDVKGLMGEIVPSGRKLSIKLEVSYLLEAGADEMELSVAPTLHLSTDAQNVKSFGFASQIKASNKKWVTFSAETVCDLSDTTGEKIEWAYITLFNLGNAEVNVYVDDIKLSLEGNEVFFQGFEGISSSADMELLKSEGIQPQWGGNSETECSIRIYSLNPEAPPKAEEEETGELPAIVHSGTKALLVYDLVNPWDTAKIDISRLMGDEVPNSRKITLDIEISYLIKADGERKNIPLAPTVYLSSDGENAKEFKFEDKSRAMGSTNKWVTFSGSIVCDMSGTKGNKFEWAYITLFNTGAADIGVYVDDISITYNGKSVLSQGFEQLKPSATLELLKNNGIQTQWGGSADKECSYKIVSTVKEIVPLDDIATGWKGEVCKGTRALRIFNRVDTYVAPMFNIRKAGLEGHSVKSGEVFNFNVTVAFLLGEDAKASQILNPLIQVEYLDGTIQQFWSTTQSGAVAKPDGGWVFYSGDISCDFTNANWQNNGGRSVKSGSVIKSIGVKMYGLTDDIGKSDIYIDELSIKYNGEEMCPYGSFEMLVTSQITTAGFLYEYGGIGSMEIVKGIGAVESDRPGTNLRNYSISDLKSETEIGSNQNVNSNKTENSDEVNNADTNADISTNNGLKTAVIIVDAVLAAALLVSIAMLAIIGFKKKKV